MEIVWNDGGWWVAQNLSSKDRVRLAAAGWTRHRLLDCFVTARPEVREALQAQASAPVRKAQRPVVVQGPLPPMGHEVPGGRIVNALIHVHMQYPEGDKLHLSVVYPQVQALCPDLVCSTDGIRATYNRHTPTSTEFTGPAYFGHEKVMNDGYYWLM